MSISRWGGFRTGKRVFSQWETRKSPSATLQESPASVQDFDYTQSQGIWNLRSTTQFFKKNSSSTSISWSFVANSNSVDSSTIVIPATVQEGDVAVLFDSTATGATATPTGWSSILSLNNTFETSVSYKILGSSDAGTTITGQTNTTYSIKIMFVFRPSSSVSTATISSLVNSGETSATPAQQTVTSSTEDPQTIVFGMIRAYQTQPFIDETTWTDSVYQSEGSGNHMKVFYEIQSTNATRTITASADYGAYNFTMGFALNAN
jgi:hypothetical protein